jgi:site-specific DNA-methyltransferase (adenine-specific)
MGDVRLILGDCLEVLPTLEAGKITAIVTDPPYGMRWDTDCTRFSGGSEASRKKRGIMGGHDWKAPIRGDSTSFDPSPWLGFPKVILWGANHYAARLPIGTTLVWLKRHEHAFGSFLSDAEIGWMKGNHGVYCHKDISMNGLARRRLHPNQKPVGLMRWCVERLHLKPGSTILDPYMGSGSTAVAALELGHNFIGIESEPEHFAKAERRIAARRASTPLFDLLDISSVKP